MISAGEFFADRDINSRIGLDSADKLWDWIKAGGTEGTPAISWGLKAGENLFYRGVPDSSYNLSSRLWRECHHVCKEKNELPVREHHMQDAENAVLEAVKDQGMGRGLTDGQLLMILQHHDIPTRLMDVTSGPAEALYFAVDQSSTDGRLFILHPHDAAIDLSSDDLPWTGKARGTGAASDWTHFVAPTVESLLDARMAAQRGRFLVGGLPRRYAGNSTIHNDQIVPSDELQELTSLGVNFIRRMSPRPNSGWRATGWTVLVKSEWKKDLLRKLADEGINRDSMYPPLAEVARLATVRAHEAAKSSTP